MRFPTENLINDNQHYPPPTPRPAKRNPRKKSTISESTVKDFLTFAKAPTSVSSWPLREGPHLTDETE